MVTRLQLVKVKGTFGLQYCKLVMPNIHWFPGHMKKALIEIEEKIKLIDVVIELIDSRAPFSSQNHEFKKYIQNKPKLIIMTKADLSDENKSKRWKESFEKEGNKVIFADLTKNFPLKLIEEQVESLAIAKREKEIRKGIKPQPIRVAIIGIPNVGKSTLINKLTKTKSTTVGNKPGVTKSQQWVRINKNMDLLDTPGILPAKYENSETSLKLALIGSIRDEILPISELAKELLNFLRNNYRDSLKSRYGLDFDLNNEQILAAIAKSRGFLNSNGEDINLASKTLLVDFKAGNLGRITLEEA